MSLAQNKTIMIIIVVIVIAIVALFVFKSNIFDFFKNLPNYDSGQGGEISVDEAELINMAGKIINGDIYYLYNGKLVDTNLKVLGSYIYIGDLYDIEVGRINFDNKTAFNPVLLDDSITLSNEIIKRVPSQFSDIFRATVLKQLYGKKVSNNLNSLIPKDGKSLLGLDLKATEIKKRDKVNPELILNWEDTKTGNSAYRDYRDDLDNKIEVETFLDFDAQGNPVYKSEVSIIKISNWRGEEIPFAWILTKNENYKIKIKYKI